MVWDMRATSMSLSRIPPSKVCSVNHILQSKNTNGDILVGYNNGLISSFSFDNFNILWVKPIAYLSLTIPRSDILEEIVDLGLKILMKLFAHLKVVFYF